MKKYGSAAPKDEPRYSLRLYVTGSSRLSLRAVKNLREICEQYIPDRYDLDVVDIYQRPELARAGEIIAAPTLVKTLPPPTRRLIGDFSDLRKVLVRLELARPEKTS